MLSILVDGREWQEKVEDKCDKSLLYHDTFILYALIMDIFFCLSQLIKLLKVFCCNDLLVWFSTFLSYFYFQMNMDKTPVDAGLMMFVNMKKVVGKNPDTSKINDYV